MKKIHLRNILQGLSFSTALFVFQACYGTPQDFGTDLLIEGQVKSQTSGLPVPGIKVSVQENMQYTLTDQEGKFSFYTEMADLLTLQFRDSDSLQNGWYSEKDTVLNELNEEVYLEIFLDEK